MTEKIVIGAETPVGARLHGAAENQRVIFFAGLPGVGKSLFLQQQTLIAHGLGRRVHLLQWDSAREAFETGETLRRFPEVAGTTHPAVRKAVGIWARRGVVEWHRAFPSPEHILIGELPIVGGRLVELVQKTSDEAEPLLSGAETTFFIPVPTEAVRAHIEGARRASLERPKHEMEKRDAPVDIVQRLWLAVRDLAVDLELTTAGKNDNDPVYDPAIYRRVFEHLLRHRQTTVLSIAEVLPMVGSVYDLDVPVAEITAGRAEVEKCFADVARRFPGSAVDEAVARWYDEMDLSPFPHGF